MRNIPRSRSFELLAILLAASQIAGCGAAMASRSRTRYVVAHGQMPRPEEIRVEEFLADYPESLPDPGPAAAGMTIEGARAAWAAESSEPLLVVQTAVRGRNPDTRPPVALMFVVDRSGSMAQQDKMTYVREALHRLTDELDPNDVVGITAFDDVAQVLLPPTAVGEAATIHQAIDTLVPRGATNLSEGLRTGYAALAAGAPYGTLRRVVLLTDAIANVGETDLATIASQAERNDAEGIRLSAIGVGLDHEDAVLTEMARRGRGNHYFLDSPQEITRVFEHEVHGLLEDVADRVRLSFTPAPGVSVVRVEGASASPNGPHWQGDLGRLGAMQHRVVLWTLRGVDPHDRSPQVGTFTLDFVDLRNGEPQRQLSPDPVLLVVDAAQGTVARNSAVAWMARDLRTISQLTHDGQHADAQQRLDRVRAVIGAVAAARPQDSELQRDLAMLDGFAHALARHTGQPVNTFRARIRVDVEGG